MRAASDLHLAPHTAIYVFQALADLRADAEAHGGPTVLAGDIWDQPKVVDVPLLNRLRDELRAFPGPVIVIPGNHDQYDGGRNACEALEQSNVRVINEATIIQDVGLCVPYTDPASWGSIVAPFKPKLGENGVPPIIVAHQGFKGSYLNSMVRDRSGIRVDGLLDGVLVITGHYHMPQNTAQVIYCGSPYQTNHAETRQAKGFLVWPSRVRSAEWTDWLPERRPYTSVTAPHFWTVAWDGVGEPALPAEYRKGDIVRIATALTREALEGAPAKALKNAGLQGATIITTPTTVQRVNLRGGLNPAEACVEYIAAHPSVDPVELREFIEGEGAWPAV